MNFLKKILASIAVLFIGTLLMVGAFWFNFRNFKIDFHFTPSIINNDTLNNYFNNGSNDALPSPSSSNSPANTAATTTSTNNASTTTFEELSNAISLSTSLIHENLSANTITPTNGNILTREGIIAETNRQRQINLGDKYTLLENNLLDQAAQSKIDDMFAQQYFEHISPQGYDATYFIGNTGYKYIIIGENLAMGEYENDTDLVQAWMDSPDHRENILKKVFTQIGAATGYGYLNNKKVWLAVQEFAASESICPLVDEQLSHKIDEEKNLLDNYASQQEKLAADMKVKKELIKIQEDNLNQIAASSNSYSQIKTARQTLNNAISQVNSLIKEYNENVAQAKKIYEQYQIDVNTYNSQINSYNACLSAL